jgi:hypothetical protein
MIYYFNGWKEIQRRDSVIKNADTATGYAIFFSVNWSMATV